MATPTLYTKRQLLPILIGWELNPSMVLLPRFWDVTVPIPASCRSNPAHTHARITQDPKRRDLYALEFLSGGQ
jgi:hypothetical protein